MAAPLPRTADCLFLSGATASGKTALGLELAERMGGEVISLDSMALYRGMDIGTAKPMLAERARVPHHLIDVLEPDQEFSVAQYLAHAEAAVQQIEDRGHRPVFVGGTPLYLKALLRGLFVGPEADWELRKQLLAEREQTGPAALHARLAQIDPQAAARLHPADGRRVIRAIEVFEKTGRTISQWQQEFDRARPAEQCRVFVLDWPREQLVARIDERVEQMFAAGLIDEVRSLLAGPHPPGRTASQAVGYREVIEHLTGVRDQAATVELVKLRTRQFAKRQMTWFRSLSECRWVPMTPETRIEDLADLIQGI